MYFWGVGMPCSYNFVAKLYCIDIRGRLGPSGAARIRPRLSWAILGHLGPSGLSGAVQAVRGRLGLYGAVRDSLKWFLVIWGHVGPSRAVRAVLGHLGPPGALRGRLGLSGANLGRIGQSGIVSYHTESTGLSIVKGTLGSPGPSRAVWAVWGCPRRQWRIKQLNQYSSGDSFRSILKKNRYLTSTDVGSTLFCQKSINKLGCLSLF
jgi:hypothetical protein